MQHHLLGFVLLFRVCQPIPSFALKSDKLLAELYNTKTDGPSKRQTPPQRSEPVVPHESAIPAIADSVVKSELPSFVVKPELSSPFIVTLEKKLESDRKLMPERTKSVKSAPWVLTWNAYKNLTKPNKTVAEPKGFAEQKKAADIDLPKNFDNDFLDVDRKPGNLGKAWIVVWIMPIFFLWCFCNIAVSHCYWK